MTIHLSDPHLERPKFVYVGRKSCGCCVALVTDFADKLTARSVAEFIESGLTIDRYSFDQYISDVCKEPTFMNCIHVTHQLELSAIPMPNGTGPTPPADPCEEKEKP